MLTRINPTNTRNKKVKDWMFTPELRPLAQVPILVAVAVVVVVVVVAHHDALVDVHVVVIVVGHNAGNFGAKKMLQNLVVVICVPPWFNLQIACSIFTLCK